MRKETEEKDALLREENRSVRSSDVHKLSIQAAWFNFRFTKYYYEKSECCFLPVEFDYYKTFEEIHKNNSHGISEGCEYNQTVEKYGKCNIQVPEKGVFQLLIEEILSPFYVFQVVGITMWYLDSYEIYATFVIVTYCLSITIELIDIKRNIRNLKKMVDYE